MPEMTTSVRWTAEETKRVVLLVFSGLTAVNVARRLIKDRRVGVGEALAAIASISLIIKEFARHAPQLSQEPSAVPDEEVAPA